MASSTTTATAVKHKLKAHGHDNETDIQDKSKTKAALEFAHQAERLGQYVPSQEDGLPGSTHAVEAHFVTPQDPVIQTAEGGRLPAVPVEEATKLNQLNDVLNDRDPSEEEPSKPKYREAKDGTIHGRVSKEQEQEGEGKSDAPLGETKAPWRTNPLFPPLPMYGPPTLMRRLQCWTFRVASGFLSLLFLLVIILGAAFTSIPGLSRHIWYRLTFRDPLKKRPFYEEEKRRKKARRLEEKAWKINHPAGKEEDVHEGGEDADEFVPLEGGPDLLKCDIRYYARRVGLDCEIFEVQTEDGFIIELWHLYNPREYKRTDTGHRAAHSPEIFPKDGGNNSSTEANAAANSKKYPVLMIHGLLQSAGAYCTNGDDSLAFFLAKSGYDVWLGNNRCGFKPRHVMLHYGDPRMWAWNIRQMGVMDLPALISRVLSETGFEKLGLVAHSQGTTQSLVAMAKEQRPEIGETISVFCALAPAAYAGPLIGKAQFKFMRIISPGMFRAVFGIHAFIPFMMMMHSLLPGKFYGAMGYRVFSFLFDWTDDRWERDLRDRMFQFSPVYVSAESMRWWLGRECFAKQKCILATREEKKMEDEEDEREDQAHSHNHSQTQLRNEEVFSENEDANDNEHDTHQSKEKEKSDRARYAWYGPSTPPFALWICGADDLVDGRRLLRRFERHREPYVSLVHAKIIEGYEHLDVLWAMDAIEKVGKEVREVLWKTASVEARRVCKVPRGCEDIEEKDFFVRGDRESKRELDATAGEWSHRGKEQVGGGQGEGTRDLEKEILEKEEELGESAGVRAEGE